MLYLIRTFGRGRNKTALKIGFTDNLKNRSQSYRVHNPFFEPVSIREGDRILEAKLHLYLTARGYKEDFLDEWFVDCPEVLSLFHTKLSKINKTIWKSRNALFGRADFKGSGNDLKQKIYEELRMTNPGPYKQQVDLDWKIESSQKILKRLRSDSKLLD